jgi:N-acetylglucosamine malate deacetylase 1
MVSSSIQYKLLSGFNDPNLSPEKWNDLVSEGASDVIFLTWHWQKVWWDVFGRGQLLLVVAEREDGPVAIAPLFAEYGMIYFVGSGGSDFLDFIGEISEASVLEGMLLFAIQYVKDFAGCQFYHVSEDSRTNTLLKKIAERRQWQIHNEGGWTCPRLEISKHPEQAIAATRKKSLLRHEAHFQKSGDLKVEHLERSEDILPHLNDFFEQHITRWEQTRFPSLFLEEKQKDFFKGLTETATETGWCRFTRIIWNEETIAYHFGFHYKGSFFWYKPTFAVVYAKHSPGEVLIRQLLLQAMEESATVFDFGLGDEVFKERFATSKKAITNWGLYKPAAKKVLVMSPHPDDESIGCGGTIRKHIVEGDTVEVIFLTSGEHGGIGKTLENQTVSLREEESKKAATILEIPGIHFWREPDGNLEATENNINKLVEKVREFQADIIYVPHENEEHPDHKAAAQIVKKALGLLPDSLEKKPAVLMYEVWTPIQKFGHVVDITPYIEAKRSAIAAYESQCSMVKFHEAILGLNRYRGEMHSWPGGDYAEIFEILKA